MLTPNQLKWIAALESGKYTQRRNVLTTLDDEGNMDGNCCLGVACEVATQNGVDLVIENDTYSGVRRYDGATSALPERVIDWLGASSADPQIGQARASALNDVAKLTFTEIASAIRADGVW